MSELPSARRFTGERLHADQALFSVDLARHQAAYRFACEQVGTARVLDLGSGSGHGTAELSANGAWAVGLDRVPPDPQHRRGGPAFLQASFESPPVREAVFDWGVSFQVIEHVDDGSAYLETLARMLRSNGSALVTTPNRLASDGVNPYHVHEYTGQELASLAASFFFEVRLLGVGASPRVGDYLESRARRVAALMRLDPLGLRHRLPRKIVQWLFARLAMAVRQGVRREGKLPSATWQDFPIGAINDACLDLLAICHRPRR